MAETNLTQIMELKEKSLSELQTKHQELFPDQPTPSSNKVYLWRKIAYRLQELEYGGISAEAQNKIQQLIQQFDPINNKTLRPDDTMKERPRRTKLSRDKRLPIPGTVIIKEYKGVKLEVKILESGFEFRNKIYKSLTAIAKEITGAHWNGYLFFNL
jgi:hypothetical protein